ncbi:MAG: ABC transporter substrate-binding protein [Planctomycetes bacterium]|nr:ABC transporter substrate-binding protein [Planctomycetota bacterium]
MTPRAPLLPLVACALLLVGCPQGPSTRAPEAGTSEGEGQTLSLAGLTDALPDEGEPRRGGTLIFGRGADTVSLDPADVTDGESVKAIEALFDTLVRYEAGGTEVEPALATAWEVSDDRKTWTFTLREGVKFHDGTALDADAVVFSFERQRDPAHEFHQGEFVYWQDQFSFVTRVSKKDERTVVFELDRPFVPFLTNLAMFTASIVSPAGFRAAKEKGASPASMPVGTGPFKLAEWRRGDAIVLEAFDDHWGGRPHLDKLVLRTIPDNNTRFELLKKGDLQAMDGLNLADVQLASQAKDVTVLAQPGMNVAYLAFNNRRKPFDDPRVRQACAMALDLDRVAARIYYGLATPAANPLPPTLFGHNDDLRPRKQDREAAKKLLAEAGHPNGFKTTLWTMTNPRPYLPQPDKMAQYVKAALAQIGVEATIVPKEWASYLEEVQKAEHDMCFLGWTGDTGDPDNFLYVLLDKDNARVGSASNYSFYEDEVVHDLLGRARVEADPPRREALYKQAQEKIHADCPMVPLVHTTQVAAFRSKVRGFRLHPTGILDFRRTWLAE